MAPSNRTLPDVIPPDESAPYLYIDDQNVIIRHCWTIFGCVAPLALFWLGVLLCSALVGW